MTERAVGVRRDERQSRGLSRAEVSRATRQEIRSTYRVYVREWLIDSRHPSEEAARAHAEARYAGRLRPEDVSVDEDADTCLLRTRRWNVKAEWKDEAEAEEHTRLLEESGAEATYVPRNSRREHALTSYGVLKLPSG